MMKIDAKKRKKIESICKEVLKEIKPSDKEQLKTLTKVRKVMYKIHKGLKKEGIDAKLVLGGSLGKETNLR